MQFLPYLLQDLWELGSNPEDIIELIKKHTVITGNTRILDLACGKGAVSTSIAQYLNVKITGIDLVPEFIDYAKQKANELCVDAFCHFETGDINNAILTERNYDFVILGSAGSVLGTPKETLDKLRLTVKPNGYIVFYDVYLLDSAEKENLKYKDNEYLTYRQWLDVFTQSGMKPLDSLINKNASKNESNNKAIMKRVNELIDVYPEKKSAFESFMSAQLDGSYDLENGVIGVTWLLKAE